MIKITDENIDEQEKRDEKKRQALLTNEDMNPQVKKITELQPWYNKEAIEFDDCLDVLEEEGKKLQKR